MQAFSGNKLNSTFSKKEFSEFLILFGQRKTLGFVFWEQEKSN